MINRQALLAALQKLLARLEADLLERSESAEVPDVGRTLRAEYDRAKAAERTAQNYEDWRTDAITQAAAAWVLSCVFVRFLEDNRLIDPPKIAGAAGDAGDRRLERSRDEHELYFRHHPRETDREYLLSVFDELAKLPGTKDVFGEHNPIRELPNWLSGDAAGELLGFFQKIDANTGTLVHDFSDANWDTRFLGDLYQDLSEAARKKYALLQTPEFVEEFILDRTLNPALDEFGLDAGPVLDQDGKPITETGFRMIDPACGSGHFLLGAFPRILDRWQRKEPGTTVRELVQRTLNSIHGVDVNPYAVAIARFRLLLAAMRACNISRLAGAPGFRFNLACGDSLLHAPLRGGQHLMDFDLTTSDDECEHVYHSEDLQLLKRYLRLGQYHAVVANPPYVQPSDTDLSARYRKRFSAHQGSNSLAVPFMQQVLALTVADGFTGQITANGFMTNAYGRRLVQDVLPKHDVTLIIDSSRAHVPGHGTGHALIFVRRRMGVSTHIRVVLGKRGELQVPEIPARGSVWMAIVGHVDLPGYEDDFISVVDSPRAVFANHPWVLSGGGASDLQREMSDRATQRLHDFVKGCGFFQDTHADDAFVHDPTFPRRMNCDTSFIDHIRGEDIRHWSIELHGRIVFPYEEQILPWKEIPLTPSWAWFHALRIPLWNRTWFSGGTYKDAGMPWFVYHQIPRDRAKSQIRIAFAATATHNNFALATMQLAFNRSAPVVDLDQQRVAPTPPELSSVLNSSAVGFWLRQNSQPKAGGGIGRGLTPFPYEQRRQFSCATVLDIPMPDEFPVELSESIHTAACRMENAGPKAWLRRLSAVDEVPTVERCRTQRSEWESSLAALMSLQEELDWTCYRLYGLINEELTVDEPQPLKLGHRAFEIVLARQMAAGETQTTWFERHGSTPITELPAGWPDAYRKVVERRIALIESDSNIRLIEQPEYKRRWDIETWESRLERSLRDCLLYQLESYFDFDGRMSDSGRPTAKLQIGLVSVATLSDCARQDAEFQQVGELYREDPAFDVQALVVELVAVECVPLLPALRYKPSGLIKRRTWERTWDLQRHEDAIDARTKLPTSDPDYLSEDAARDLKQDQVGNIPVPTRYESKDFLDSKLWQLRGKLDVPKERWISFPHCEGPDGTLVICWAGYDHLQQAQAISAYYVRVQTEFGGTDDPRLVPLLACLIELLPWLKQWHNEPDAGYDGMRMGDYFEGFINEEARQLGKTLPEIKAWTPPARTSGRRRRAGT